MISMMCDQDSEPHHAAYVRQDGPRRLHSESEEPIYRAPAGRMVFLCSNMSVEKRVPVGGHSRPISMRMKRFVRNFNFS